MSLADPKIFKNRRIIVQYVSQQMRHGYDDDPYEDLPIDVDITEELLSMELSVINFDFVTASVPNIEKINGLIPSGIINSLFFRVEGFIDQLTDFFMDENDYELLEISQEKYEAARKAHRIGEDKRYTVTVTRTVTQTLNIPVQAISTREAIEIAADTAGIFDFNEGTKSDPEYSVESASVVDTDQTEISQSADVERPRPRMT